MWYFRALEIGHERWREVMSIVKAVARLPMSRSRFGGDALWRNAVVYMDSPFAEGQPVHEDEI